MPGMTQADVGPAEVRQDGAVRCVAVLARDYPDVIFDLRVAEGDKVLAGQALCHDRARPEICLVSPVAGRVSHISFGARRRLVRIDIAVQADSDAARRFDTLVPQDDGAGLRRLLQQAGAWASFRTRPFGHLPDPDASPAAIFVIAAMADPGLLDTELLHRGMAALKLLTPGPLILCQPAGPPLLPEDDRLRLARFSGPSRAAGPMIHRMMPVSRQRMVWQATAQDVVAIGHLLACGQIMGTRVVTRAGQGPVVLPLGAVLDRASQPCLGRYDLHLDDAAADPRLPVWKRLLARLPQAKGAAMLPLESFERAFPFAILPAPLMRALACGDVETAERLGCLELLEEDVASLGALCPSGSDYGAMLRRVLRSLAQEVRA